MYSDIITLNLTDDVSKQVANITVVSLLPFYTAESEIMLCCVAGAISSSDGYNRLLNRAETDGGKGNLKLSIPTIIKL